ncbi:aryl-alcohol dehydrogenase-like predicted oxidoreductase [Pseudoduganella flava]|uniref:Aldo/keto reductase n=1 Tax=Pseudoduganella flava TaxID=871742 RepID=A0A562Q159_9BURK|nr:aldo/keto reductase [Pseudoduganella flava]QGZ38080.1 aldo/keto reductase [Pseudoduganella flava]TWI50409.1 aryl-alcohol dehydrogenase-like predicted oxidoreductase [Pseudoduganella flava]
MRLRQFGSDGMTVPEIGLGCWQLGGGWRDDWDNDIAQQTLATAYAAGVRFIDTADVYGDGASERSIGQFLARHQDPALVVATKLGRAGIYPDGYTRAAVREATLRSIDRLGVQALDLTQLHCVPTDVLRGGHVFDWLRELQQEGLIKRWGASVESVEEGLICLQQPGLASLQVIFNLFRQKPAEELLPRAAAQQVGIIVRLPLASGLLGGKITRATTFRPDDHRHFNRDGQAFNVGETFAGLELERGIAATESVAALVPAGLSMAQMALRWILDHDAVSVVIPGASSPAQVQANVAAAGVPPLPAALHAALADVYRTQVRDFIRGPY